MQKYSVLMSVYKNDKPIFLEDAIGDLLNQTIPPSEIVLIIDGYISEALEAIIIKYSNKFNIVRIEKNVGLGKALQIGLEYIENEFIMRMDSDDRCTFDRAEKLLNFFRNNDGDVVGSFIKEFKYEIEDSCGIIKYKISPTFKDIYNYRRDTIGHASVMFRTKSLKNIGGYQDCLFFEDTYLWLRMNMGGMILQTIPEVLYYARISDGFEGRRGGWKYMVLELKHFLKFRSEGLISWKSFFGNIIIRPFIRLLPAKILSKFYQVYLRD